MRHAAVLQMTTDAHLVLAESACVEPLVARWPAWPHVLAPVTQSLHLSNYQSTVLRSYLSNPDGHETACRNPMLFGGAFVDIPSERAPEVKALLDETVQEFGENVEFARSLIEFHNRIAAEAEGASLEGYYSRVPAPLRGYVELIYDYYNHPIVRCLESSIYRSRYYKKNAQSLRLFELRDDVARPYFMSTPRLPEEASIDWSIPFDDAQIDALFALDLQPRSFDEIRDLIGAPISQCVTLRSLFRESEGRIRAPWRGPEVRIRYFGHACVLVESAHVSILIDPLISARPSRGGVDRFSFDDLPEHIDYVLVTHCHHDHFVIETLLRLRRRIGALIVPKSSGVFYGDVSLKLLARELGFRDIREVEAYDEIPFLDGSIIAAPFLGEHNDLVSAKSAFVVRFGDRRVLFSADSNCLDAAIYDYLIHEVGTIDTVFLGMESVGAPLTWVYGPILPIKPLRRHSEERRSNGCNADAASTLVRTLRCRQVFIYAVGREPWVRYLLALNPTEDDVYMTEIRKFARTLENELQIGAKLLYGRAEILI